MNRRVLSTLAVTGVLVAGTSTAAQAADTGHALISGHVVDADGAPAAGAQVAVFAETTQSTKLAEGGSTTMPLVGTAKADASGNYILTLSETLDPASYADSAGIVTFTAVAQNGIHVQSSDFQRQLDTSAGAAKLVAVDTAKAYDAKVARTAVTNLGLTATPATVPFDLGGKDARTVTRTSANKAPVGELRSGATKITVLKDYGGRWTYVGQWASTNSGARAKFSYTKSASSSLGVALSTTGGAGTFKASKSKSRSSTATVSFATRTGKKSLKYRTQFHYQKRRYQTCAAGFACWNTYKIEPVSWWGGTSTLARTLPTATKCSPFEKGSGMTKSDTTAYKFKGGVSNSGMTVVELTARSGYSSKVKQSVKFITKAGRLCGRGAKPAQNPQLLIAKN